MYLLEHRSDASLGTQTDGITKMGMHTIENAIFAKYHFSLIECSKNTYKLDAILRKVFGPSQILLERTVLGNVLGFASSADVDKECVTIQDKSLISPILNTYKDKDKERILAISSDKPHIIAEIIDLSGVSENKAYKKIDEMIRDGLLIEAGAMVTSDGREIKKYVSVFKNLEFGLLKNKIAIKAKLSKEALNASQIILLLQSLKNKMVDEQQEQEQYDNFVKKQFYEGKNWNHQD
ncbi:MAG: hypothetical protein ACRD92_06445 [Nitrosopumilaceae archaeon]